MTVSVKITGDEQVEVELVSSAVAYGLNACGFGNVEITSPEDMSILPPSNDVPSQMEALRQENPAPFDVAVEIEADVVQDLISPGDVDELPVSDDAGEDDDS